MKLIFIFLFVMMLSIGTLFSQDSISSSKLLNEKYLSVELISNLSVSDIYVNLLFLENMKDDISKTEDLSYQGKVIMSLNESFTILQTQFRKFSKDVVLGIEDRAFANKIVVIYSHLQELSKTLQGYLNDKSEKNRTEFEKLYKSTFDKYQELFSK
jgi:hypothetical protein